MHKLLPFRQYDEKDVINLFQLDVSNATVTNLTPGGIDVTDKESFWSGSLVTVPVGNTKLGGDEPALSTNSYLGAIGSADQGHALQEGNQYPVTGNKVAAVAGGTANHTVLGITIRATLAFDENGEKLLYYREKLDELQAVLPGEAVPIATKGIFTIKPGAAGITNVALAATTITPGFGLAVHGTAAQKGQFTCAGKAAGQLGTILATGTGGGSSIALTTFDAGA